MVFNATYFSYIMVVKNIESCNSLNILKIDKSVILQYFQQFYEACTYKLEDLQLTITLLSQVIHYRKIKIKSFSKAHKNT